MPTTGGPGQQASANAINAIAVTRATGIALPVSSSPNNKRPTSDGTTSNAKPVTTSTQAANVSTFFIGPITSGPFCKWSDWQRLHVLALRLLLGFELERQSVDFARELERNVVTILYQRYRSLRPLET